ncbi:MAG: hypothetical protein ACOY99_13115 [Pseudomonadota bacterium]
MRLSRVAFLVASTWATILGGPATVQAETTEKDIQVAARAVAFMENAPSGDTPAAIIYDPANGATKAEAEAIQKAMGAGLKAGNANLQPKLVAVGSLGDLAGARVAFVTGGLGAQHGAIFAAAAPKSILTVSTDMSCVDAGKCVVGVMTQPKVEIIVSKAARDASSISFAAAFLMMVKEK